ncbi:MAG: hypothetical protein AAF830_09885 [Pseudomonadota bacterium]
MQLDELFALLGPDGFMALGETVSISREGEALTQRKAVVTLAAKHKKTSSPAPGRSQDGEAIFADPAPCEGDVLTIRSVPYAITSVRDYADGYTKCSFGREAA